jgi:diguanylate cyclase (GGDEF)-like protein
MARIKRARDLQTRMHRDGLTQLLTRAAFVERAGAMVADARRRPERRRALVLLDVDDLKAINDGFGHAAGDRALTALAGLLRRRLRPSDAVGRIGGDEFAVVVEDLAEGDVARVVSRLLEEFRATSIAAPDGGEFSTTFSAGIAMLGAEGLEEWMHAADTALYDAKRAGRGCVRACRIATSAG